MMKKVLLIFFGIALCAVHARSFNGIDQVLTVPVKPGWGRLGLTVGFFMKTTPESFALAEGQMRKVMIPFSLNAKNAGEGDFSGTKLSFTATVGGGYATAKVLPYGGFAVLWSGSKYSRVDNNRFIPVFFVLGDGKFELYVDGINYANISREFSLPLEMMNAPEYLISLGGWKSGRKVRYLMACEIKNLLVFDRVLSRKEVKTLSADPDKAAHIPGLILHKKLHDKEDRK